MNHRFNLSAWALQHRPLVLFFMTLVAVLGVFSYTRLAQSEDPPFTFKVMVIQAMWPGATARQMQEEVSDRIARKLQETPNIDFLRSYSRPGETQIFFNVRDSAPPGEVPYTWYLVRKKVADMAAQLPPGLVGPFFNDEFGDVYTNLLALEGDGYSYAQLHDAAEDVRAELLRVPSVAKVDLIGDQAQHVTIELDDGRIARLGLSIQDLANVLGQQNAVAPAGVYTAGPDRLFVRPSGQFESLDDIRATALRVNGRALRLGDIATVRRGYDDPPAQLMRFGGKPVLGIGITMQTGADVIALGTDLQAALARIQSRLPAGLSLGTVTSMPRAVARSVDDFVEAVAEAIGIVLAVSLLSLGLRTGMVVVITIPFVLAATAWFMKIFDVGLHKVSLGTLILALGLLVDDAIIAIEMMKVKLEQGWERTRAAAFAYDSTAFPMLTGTLVTTAGFLPIALARSGTGEYTRSIFQVSAIALVISWLAAVIVIPLLGYHLLPQHAGDAPADAAPGWLARREHWLATRIAAILPAFLQPAPVPARATRRLTHDGQPDVYDTPFYTRLRAVIDRCLRHRWWVLAGTVALFVVAMASFGSIPKQFFPSSDRPELLVDLRLPEGASIHATLALAKRMEALLAARPEVESTASFIGSGAPRFYLPLDQQLPQPNFAQFLVTARDVPAREALAAALDRALATEFTAAHGRITRLETGPPVGFPVRFRVQGSDIATVRGIADQVAQLLRTDARLANIQFDWDEPAERSVRLEIDQEKARLLPQPAPERPDGHAVPRARQAHRGGPARARGTAPRSGPDRPVELPDAGRRHRAPGAAGSRAQWPRIRRDLGARPPAHHYRAVRHHCRCPAHRRLCAARCTPGRHPRAAAVRLPHRDGRVDRGKRQSPGLDQCADARDGARRAHPADDPDAEFLARAHGGADGTIGPDRRRGRVAALWQALRLCRAAGHHRDVRHHHAQLRDPRRPDRAGHRRRRRPLGGHRGRHRAALPPDNAHRRGRRAGADPAIAQQFLRTDGNGPDGRHNGGHRAHLVLPARALCDMVSRTARGTGSGRSGMKRTTLLAPLWALLTLGGCTVGPDFHAPVPPRADRYTVVPAGANTVVADGSIPQFPATTPPARWWVAYGSPALDDWVAEGLARNRDLQSTTATLAAAREQLRARIGQTELPTAGAELQAARQRALGLPNLGPPTSVYQLFAGVVQVDYTIDLFGGVRRANEAARADVDVQSHELAAARQSLAANIVIAAIRSSALCRQVQIQANIVTLAQRRADLVQRRFERGAVPSGAVREARRAWRDAAAELPGLQAQWDRARNGLAVLLGRAPQDAPGDLDFATLKLPVEVPVAVPSALVRARPDILAAEAALHAATARVGVATANLFPQLSLTGSYGSESFHRASFLHNPSTVWGASGTVLQPLFEGGALRAQRGAANALLDAAEQRYAETVLRAFGDVGDALLTLQADAQALEQRAAAQGEAERLYADTARRHAQGAASLLDELASEQALLQERLAGIASAQARLVDTASLFQAVGAPDS